MHTERKNHHQVLILGGGTAGITVAARLQRKRSNLQIAIVEPSTKHYYQPLWTLAGAGVFPKELSEREESAFIPQNATWIRESVHQILPNENAIITREGTRITYDYLVVALGIQIDWDSIPGLRDGLGTNNICSNYSYQHVDYTWDCIQKFRGGNAVFTMPNTAVKCGGAPQKIMYLADDAMRKRGVRSNANIIYASAQPFLFAIEKYRKTLEQVVARKGIDVRLRHNLRAIDPEKKVVELERIEVGDTISIPFDMLHVTPPMSSPAVVKTSPLANAGGWVEVDQYTLQSPTYSNVFGIGDCSGLPTSKTGAAIRKQAPVVVENLLSAIESKPLVAKYDGYTSCPIVTGYGRLVLAEFDYEGKPRETFPIDQSKERLSMYLLKAYALPKLYWHGMLRGLA
jgi:sulfide:quinone oxidoreductase